MEVAIRVRPLLTRETGLSSLWNCDNKSTIQSSRDGKPISYNFDHVYGPDIDTVTIYNQLAEKIVVQSMQGYHGRGPKIRNLSPSLFNEPILFPYTKFISCGSGTIFTYGQSGSGKTYTMDGLTKLALDSMYQYISKSVEREFILRVSYVELYNEQLFDLLAQKDGVSLVVREDIEKQVYIEGLTEEVVYGKEDALSAIHVGNEKRRFAETKQNDLSSRAHCILRIIIESRMREEGEDSSVLLSHLNLVDLAGSEKAADGSERLREGCHINKSLLALSLVVTKLSEDQNTHINYRDSKITRILQNALGGNSRTAILCMISPTSFEETLSTLRFANNARFVKNKPQQNLIMSVSAQLKKALMEIETLKKKLQKVNHCTCGDEGVPCTSTESLPVIPDASLVEMEPFKPPVVEGSRRKSMFVDNAKSRRRSFFVTSRSSSRRKTRESKHHDLQLNDSGWGDSNILSSVTADNMQDDNDNDLGHPAEMRKDSSFQIPGSDESREREEIESPNAEVQSDLNPVNNNQVEDLQAPLDQGPVQVHFDDENANSEADADLQYELDQEKIQSLRNLIEKGKEMLRNKDTEILTLRERIDELQDLYEAKKEKEADADISAENPENEDSQKQEENRKAKEDLEHFRQELEKRDAELSGQQSLVQTLEQTIRHLKEENDEREARLQEIMYRNEIEDSQRLREDTKANEDLEHFRQELEKELTGQQTLIQTLEQTIRNLKEENDEREAKFQETMCKNEVDNHQKQEENRRAKEGLEHFRQELEKRDAELTGQQSLVQTLEQTIRNLKEINDERETKFQEILHKNENEDGQRQEENRKAKEDLEHFRQELEKRDAELTGQQSLVQTLEQTIRNLKEMNDEKEAKFQENMYRNENEDSQIQEENRKAKDLEHFRQELDKRDAELIGQQSLVQTLEQTIRNLKEMNDERETKFQEDMYKIEIEDSQRQEENRKAKEDLEHFRQELEKRDAELSGQQSLVQTLEQTIRNLKEMNDEREAKLQEDKYRNEIEDSQKEEENRKAKEGLEHFRQELEKRDAELTGQQSLVQTLEQTIRNLKEVNDEKEARLQEAMCKYNIEDSQTLSEDRKANGVLEHFRQELEKRDTELFGQQSLVQTLEQTIRNLKEMNDEREAKFQENMCKNEMEDIQRQGENRKAKEDLEHFRQELEKRDAELSGQQSLVQTLEQTIRNLEEMNDEKETKFQESIHKNEIEDSQKEEENRKAKEDLEHFRQELEKRDAELSGQQSLTQTLEQTIRNFKETNDEMEAKLQETMCKNEIEDSQKQEQNRKAKEDLEHFRQELEKRDAELSGQQSLTQTLEQTIRNFKETNDEMEAKLQETMCKNEIEDSQKQEQNRKAKEDLEHFRHELEKRDAELSGQQSLVQTLEQTIRNLKETNDEREAKLQENKYRNKIEDSQKEEDNRKAKEDLEHFRQELEKRDAELTGQQSLVQTLEQTIRNLKEMNDERVAKFQESVYRNEIEDSQKQEQNRKAKEDLEHFRQELEKRDAELSGQQSLVQTLEQTIRNLKETNDEREAKLQENKYRNKIEDSQKEEDKRKAKEDLEHFRQELDKRDAELTGQQSLVQTLEQTIRNLKEVNDERVAKFQESVYRNEIEDSQKQEENRKAKEDLEHFRQELEKRDAELTGQQSLVQTLEQTIRHLKEMNDEREAKLQEDMCKKEGSSTGSSDVTEKEDQLQGLRCELEEMNTKLKLKDQHIMTCKQFAETCRDKVNVKNKEIKNLTADKKKMEKDCERLEKSREEDREYYEMVIEKYKLKIRKTQHLDSSYLQSEGEKPLQSCASNSQTTSTSTLSRADEKENIGGRVKEKELTDKLYHYEETIKDLRAQIADTKTNDAASSSIRAQGFPSLAGGSLVDHCVMINKNRYIKKLEHKLKEAEAQIKSLKGE